MAAEGALLPCPMCGGHARLFVRDYEQSLTAAYCVCDGCGLRTKLRITGVHLSGLAHGQTVADIRHGALDDWNRRT